MVNPGGSDKLGKSPEEEHLQDVSSDQENMNTPPSAPFQGGKNIQGGGVPMETSKKRANPGASSSTSAVANHKEPGTKRANPGASSSTSAVANPKEPGKKRQVDCYSGQHKCKTCGRPFRSLKAVHGHMRVHTMGKEKGIGASPPPAFTHPSGSSLERGCGSVAAGDYTNPVDAVPESATVPLNSAQQVHSALASGSSSAFRHLVVDLNMSPPPEERDRDDGDNIDVDIHCLRDKEGRFNLNKPPPPEEDDGDNMEYN